MQEHNAIHLTGISKKYNLYMSKKDRLKEALNPLGRSYHRDFFAVKNIDLAIKKGEILGIVGKNGSGKSTLLKLISGVLSPTAGTVETEGTIVALLELGSGMNPEYTGYENIYFYSAILGYTRKQTNDCVDDIIAFADIGDFIHQPVKNYSSGMKARLAFAVSVNVNPEILILDEVLSVGDELFRRKCHVRMQEFFEGGKTVIYVAHNVPSINELCTRAILLDRGEIILDGPAKFVTGNYQKLLFAQEDRAAFVRQDIIKLNGKEDLKRAVYEAILKDEKEMNSMTGGDESDESTGGTPMFIGLDAETREEARDVIHPKPFFIPNFIPVTTNVIRNSDIDFTEFSLNTMSGEKVNSLVQGEHYVFSFTVTFNEPVDRLNYAFGIRSSKGQPLTTRVHPGFNLFEPRTIVPGEKYALRWKFKCLFHSGNYYIGTTIRTIYKNDEMKFNRYDDILVFKVTDNSRGVGGFFNSDIDCGIQQVKE
jgi:lipopolysaccharide transport system ATP-binding protein